MTDKEGTQIHLCGRLRVNVAGRPREEQLRGRQGRLLLAFLVLNRERPVSRDVLIDALWGEENLPPSDGALAPVLSRLRRAVAPAAVEGRDSLALSLPQPAWVDVEVARGGLERARSGGTPAERVSAAQEAAEIAQAGLLPGLEAPWIHEERIALERLRVEG